VDHAGGSVHHGQATTSGGVLAVAWHAAAPRQGGLPVVVGERERSTGSSFRSSPGLGGVAMACRMGWLGVGACQ
jgi:hypothetical protein